ncbi:hypothetical protein LXA47_28580 [Massilia sp. P8910]|uniref:hypothetical protein n=1 Tax=Massilia antarctica TaxID=2765360 RepID=UPI0006BB9139|nr:MULTISPECIES: hypothetical protein [Massilia]MCE3607530.1 hypothetical protein [Massilia antarctica]MCY0912422.1 hypothetical protein [Massilia sp. H27-R4]CUI03400.1 hypothetical protein BN2497_1577 [Janthinobacterium sp. CG23_2]CUU27186.1 hypothetical protein BN3177_1577 [Janthinobacterium sp. CG23_2]
MEEMSASDIEAVSGGFRKIAIRFVTQLIYDGVGSYASYLMSSGPGNGVDMTPEMTAVNGGNLGA